MSLTHVIGHIYVHTCLQCRIPITLFVSPCLTYIQSITATDQALRAELTRDEGYRTDIYIDTEGHATVGIGHLIVSGDTEHGKSEGTKVTDERVQELFTQDLNIALDDCRTVFPNFGSLPQEGQRVLANMMFNLGRPRFIKFAKCIAAVKDSKWDKAADEMVDSRWYRQVKGRAQRLEERMRSLAK